MFWCYGRLKAVTKACQAPHFPNTHAAAVAIANEDTTQVNMALEQRAKACVQPAIQWFFQKFNVELFDTVLAFKAARVMCPVTVQWLRPTLATVEALRIFPFLNSGAAINVLIRKLPQYVSAQNVVIHAERLPCWSSAVKKMLLVQPSSAASERTFSVLSASFSDQQESALFIVY